LDSIVAQTVTLFEVVLIDDGSTDNSGRICDEYAAKDNRFRVIHQANSGVSASRQRGVDSAIGEYVIHVDSDDWIEPSMIELLYAKAKEGDYDMVICDYYVERF
jgi:glycosyltransferase involved in cell wall biosynthesis